MVKHANRWVCGKVFMPNEELGIGEQLERLIQQMVEKGVRFDAISQDFEKMYIEKVLRRLKGNQSWASRTLGMHRNTLKRKIADYDISVSEAKGFTRPSPGVAGAGNPLKVRQPVMLPLGPASSRRVVRSR